MIKYKPTIVILMTAYILGLVKTKSWRATSDENRTVCTIQCPPGNEPRCTNTSQTCVECPWTEFSEGGSQLCRPCRNCAMGYGAVALCDGTKDITCEKCIHGQTYSDSNNRWSCFPCTQCTTYASVSSPCNITHNIQCSSDPDCPLGKYYDAASESCLYCSKETEGAVKMGDCQKNGIPHKYQFSYNPFNPQPYTPSPSPHPGQILVISKPPKHSTSLNSVVPVAVSVFGAAFILIVGVLIVWYNKRVCRQRVSLQTLGDSPTDCTERNHNTDNTVGPTFPLQNLPHKTKRNLCTEFMQSGLRRVNYLYLATFSPEEKNQLQLYCSSPNIPAFTDHLFELLKTKRPQLTVGDVHKMFVDQERLDFDDMLKMWLLEDNLILVVPTTETDLETVADTLTLTSSRIAATTSESPIPSTPTESPSGSATHLLPDQ